MKNKEKTHGFFCRETFMEQIQLLQEAKQCVELFAAAFAYTKGENYDIKDAFVKMAFSSWKTVFDYDKKEADLFHKMKSDAGRIGGNNKAENRRKREAEQQQQPEQFKEETANGDDVPLVEAEEVEPYPFERFWNLYNFKHDKQPAEKAWNKLNNKDRAEAIAAIPNYHAYLEHKRSTGFNQNQAYAATYLNKRRWEDDYSITDTTPQNYGNKRTKTQYEINLERNAAAMQKLYDNIGKEPERSSNDAPI